MKKSVSQMQFVSESKRRVRSFILAYVRRSQKYLDFYGNGEMYDLVQRKTNTKIVSIDSDPKLKSKLKQDNTIFTDLRSYCQRSTDSFDCMWLDYCGPFGDSCFDDLLYLPDIMDDKGHLFITVRRGREYFIPKGTSRSVLEYGSLVVVQKQLMENNIKAELIEKVKYKSIPEYTKGIRVGNSSTSMIVYGFEWTRLKRKSESFKFNSIVKTLIDNV
jgi:hypothetical protein